VWGSREWSIAMSNILEKAKILFEDARNIELIEQNVACITTQYLDNHNDYVQSYFIAEEQEYTFTDDGWILDDIKHLPTYDENLKSIDRILKRFGIDRNEDVNILIFELI
jgi:hypothetical protein